jgi:phenylacetate-CoA ligase
VAPGQASATTLLTNLANHVQPLIRYDLGDSVTIDPQPCACGSALPSIEVAGRNDDMMWLGAPGQAAVCVLPLAISSVLDDEVGLSDFQLVQQGPQDVLLRTGMRGQVSAETLRRANQALAAFFERLGVHGMRIHCRSGEPAQTGASGKQPRVIALPH